MPQTSVTELVKSAKAQIENLTAQEVREALEAGQAVLIDIREAEELRDNGRIEEAVHAPRRMLEFYADPTLPYYKPVFGTDKKIILQCASGGRSALATQSLRQMGYENVAHLDGGIKAWKEAGLPVSGSPS